MAPDPARKLAVALDCPTSAQALTLFERLQGRAGVFKIGSELFLQAGAPCVRTLAGRGARAFLDLKFHDIPRTVAAAVREAARMGAWMCNVHAAGGEEMMRAAVEAARAEGPAMKVIAVTVLTSLQANVDDVLRMAEAAQSAGLDGVVAAPAEVRALRARCGPGFLLVTPGIRPAWASDPGDQKRIAAPAAAVADGADLLVVGRPITHAADPVAAADRILQEIAAA
jgi:orotidine-5'-phosphate decarboxylase